MGDIIDFMAWSAAEDAASAARSAENAALESTNQTTKLLDSQLANSKKVKKKQLNKMLQDIFYEREVEYYLISDIREYINSGDKRMNHYSFPEKKDVPQFPIKSSIFFIGLIYLSFLFGNTIIKIIVSLFAVFYSYSDIKNWFYWKRNKKKIELNRLNKIKKTYQTVVQSLVKDYPFLSYYGIMRKFEIDKNIRDTYEVLKSKDFVKANDAILQLYTMVLDIKNSDKSMLKMLQEQSEEIIKLDHENKLFSIEAYKKYKEIEKE